MKDETMLTAALCVTMIGLLGLFALNLTAGPSRYSISDAINHGGDVIVAGAVKSIKASKSSVLLTLKDKSGEIEAVLFDKYANIKKGDSVEAEGKISEYMGKKQLEIRKITLK